MLLQKYLSFNDIAIFIVRKNDYKINFWFINKSKPVNRMKNADLSEKSCHLWKGRWYYEENKERLQKWLATNTSHWLKIKKYTARVYQYQKIYEEERWNT